MRLKPHIHCPCGAPLVRSRRLEAQFCCRCRKALRLGRELLAEELPSALRHLLAGTGLERRRVKLPGNPNGPCGMGPGGCDGPRQWHHLVSIREAKEHPLLHHPDNLVCLCREHHRLLHHHVHGFDPAGPPRRAPRPSGWPGALSLPYARWVIGHVRPELWLKALALGQLLWLRIQHRGEVARGEIVPVSLYYGWLYSCVSDHHGIRAFKGILYDYDPHDYRPPFRREEAGRCRTYQVYASVAERLSKGPHLHLEDTCSLDLQRVLAALLDEEGWSYRKIGRLLHTTKGGHPSKSSLSNWVKRGRVLIEQAESSSNHDLHGIIPHPGRAGLEPLVLGPGAQAGRYGATQIQ